MPRRHTSLRPQQDPCVPRHSLPLARRLCPYEPVDSESPPISWRGAVWSSECLEVVPQAFLPVLCRLAGSRVPPPSSLSANNSRFGSRLSSCLANAPANRSRRWRIVASTLWLPVFLRALAYDIFRYVYTYVSRHSCRDTRQNTKTLCCKNKKGFVVLCFSHKNRSGLNHTQ